jgi:hypothetical protein
MTNVAESSSQSSSIRHPDQRDLAYLIATDSSMPCFVSSKSEARRAALLTVQFRQLENLTASISVLLLT